MQILDARSAERPFPRRELLFTMRKHEWPAVCHAVCRAVGQDLVWELHLYIGTPDNGVISVECDSRYAAAQLADKWRGQMIAKGWTESDESGRA